MTRAGDSTPLPVALIAAGEGRRLRTPDSSLPKPMTPLADGSIGGWSLGSLASAGVSEILVVVGWQAEATRSHYRALAAELDVELFFAEAKGWQRGNGISALAAAEWFGPRPFALAMADHLFSAGFLAESLGLRPRAGEVVLVIDKDPAPELDLDDLTKVRTESDRIVAIGKELDDWDAGDTGFFLCSAALGEALREAQQDGGFSLTDGVLRLAAAGRLRAHETLHAWMDIDTPEDLATAEAAAFAPFASRAGGVVDKEEP